MPSPPQPPRPTAASSDPEHAYALMRALEEATSGVLVADAGAAILYVNRAFERLFAWERDELVGRDSDVLAAVGTAPEGRRALAAALGEGRAHAATFVARRRPPPPRRQHLPRRDPPHARARRRGPAAGVDRDRRRRHRPRGGSRAAR